MQSTGGEKFTVYVYYRSKPVSKEDLENHKNDESSDESESESNEEMEEKKIKEVKNEKIIEKDSGK